jgi:dolichol-phosphate mannosyltransferase
MVSLHVPFQQLSDGAPSMTPCGKAKRSDERPDFSLVIPTYNERENLEELFARVERALADYRFEVILVDDNSPDATWAAAEDFQSQYSWLHVIRRRDERDLSSAVICGFRHARGRVLGVMDADLQHDDTRLPQLLKELEGSDFAVATRRGSGGSDGMWSRPRQMVSRMASRIARIIARTPLSDPMSGFFVMRREIFDLLDDGNLRPRGYKVLLYLYSRAVQCFGAKAVRFREVGYQFRKRERGESKLCGKVILEFVLMLADIRWHARPEFARAAISHAVF